MPQAFDSILSDLGLTTNLRLCLDAGDADSYTSGEPWLDLSGNGYDFNRGSTNVDSLPNPTFNGVAGGLSNAEYFSFDGGDFFTYDSTNETWMQNLHKDGAKFTFVTWIWMASTGLHRIFGTRGGTGSPTGVIFGRLASPTDVLQITCRNAGVDCMVSNSTTMTVPASRWVFIAVSLDETVGANGIFHQINDTVELFDSTYTSPAAGNASRTLQMGAGGDGNLPLPSTSRMALVAMWEGVALSQANVMAIKNATKSRFYPIGVRSMESAGLNRARIVA